MPSTQTRQKLRLGHFLQRLRERSALTHRDVAEYLRRVQSSISKIENGYMLCSYSELTAMLTFYGAIDEEHGRGKELWEDAKDSVKRVRHSSTFPAEYRNYVRAEAEADSVRTISTGAIPGLLQIPAYVRATSCTAGHLVDDVMVERAVAGKRSRQKRLVGPDPLRLHAVIDECALRRRVGGSGVMREQLRHVLESAEQDHIKVQVVPFDVGAYGFSSGPMVILGFGDPDEHESVYLEHPAGGHWVRNLRNVQEYTQTFVDVADVALSPEESARLIEAAMEDLDRDGSLHDLA